MTQRKPNQSSVDLDWYLISIDRLKQIIVLAVIAGIAVAGYLYYKSAQTPRQRAQNSIDAAEASLNDLARSPEFPQHRADFDRAKLKLDTARKAFTGEKYAEAEGAAIEAQAIIRTAIAGIGERESDAQFLTVEGQVEYQKGGSGDWKKGDRNTPLFNGDWVKTGANASAELFFSNGSIYTVGSNALLEIYAAVNPTTNRKDNAVQMRVGRLEINTTEDSGTVRTPGTQVVINAESTAQVDVGTDKATKVVAIRGAAAVSPSTGGAAVPLTSGEQLSATEKGDLSAKSTYVPPPLLQAPAENQVFQATEGTTLEFVWALQEDAVAYQLLVSRSRLFTTLEINARRTENRAKVRVTQEGNFYWRVASIAADGKIGVGSPFRRFRVTGLGTSITPNATTDKVPPTLELKKPTSLGGQFYLIEGKAEAGASVFVDDEEISVDSDGTFKKLVQFTKIGLNTVVVKATDPAGNQALQRVNVYVEE